MVEKYQTILRKYFDYKGIDQSHSSRFESYVSFIGNG